MLQAKDPEDDEFYLLDTLQELHESNESMIENLEQMGQYTKELGNVVSFQSEEINNILSKMAATGKLGGSRENQKMVSVASDVINRIAVEMESYAKKLNPHVSRLPTEINTFLENYSKLYQYQSSRPTQEYDEIEEAFDSLESFVRTMLDTKNTMISFQESIVEIPALTREFRRAKKNTADSIGHLVDAITIGTNKGQAILSELDQNSS